MTVVHRVLDAEPVLDLASYLNGGGGRGLAVAAATEPDDLISVIADAGLRGRGGAGFPTGIKWRTVADSRAEVEPTAVIVNAAEGEPGTFKDRAIIRRNPYRVLEGALIAARAVGAPWSRSRRALPGSCRSSRAGNARHASPTVWPSHSCSIP